MQPLLIFLLAACAVLAASLALTLQSHSILREQCDRQGDLLRVAALRERAATEALVSRRWLRNAFEHEGQSPQKAIVGAAAVALALVGRVRFVQLAQPLACAERLTATGVDRTHPAVQAGQQWELCLAELTRLEQNLLRDQERIEELYGERSAPGDYWNVRGLDAAAAAVLTGAHTHAEQIARARLGPHAAEIADLPAGDPQTH